MTTFVNAGGRRTLTPGGGIGRPKVLGVARGWSTDGVAEHLPSPLDPSALRQGMSSRTRDELAAVADQLTKGKLHGLCLLSDLDPGSGEVELPPPRTSRACSW